MQLCEGRVAIVTGAGRGLGRAYALMLAKHGAKVVVNDLGSSAAGVGVDLTPAQDVVEEIKAAGGEAVADGSDVADWAQAKSLIDCATERFGRLDVLVTNAGILRDRMMVNMSAEDWDAVIKVHLHGTFAPCHHAANYWRMQHKAGAPVDARIINTTSASGLFGNIGQSNYAAAKAGVASFSIVIARELARIGVTVNVIGPRAETRMTEGLREIDEETRRRRDPDWIAALVTWLASAESKDISGRVFEAWGFGYSIAEGWTHGPIVDAALEPSAAGAGIRSILGAARRNAGIERDQWLDP